MSEPKLVAKFELLFQQKPSDETGAWIIDSYFPNTLSKKMQRRCKQILVEYLTSEIKSRSSTKSSGVGSGGME